MHQANTPFRQLEMSSPTAASFPLSPFTIGLISIPVIIAYIAYSHDAVRHLYPNDMLKSCRERCLHADTGLVKMVSDCSEGTRLPTGKSTDWRDCAEKADRALEFGKWR